MRIIIIHDEIRPDSRDDEADALVQAEAVADALRDLGHEVASLPVTLDLSAFAAQLRQQRPDLVFNLVESLGGHARMIHLPCHLLDSLGIPYTGGSAEAQFITSNKPLAKQLLCGANIPTPQWLANRGDQNSLSLWERAGVRADKRLSHEQRGFALNFPARCIIKSVWEHASVGLSGDSVIIAEDINQLREAIELRADSLGGEAFAEEYIHGREFNLALLAGDDDGSPDLLPPAEIVFEGYADDQPRIIDYSAKWDERSFAYTHTARRYDFPSSDDGLLRELKSLALKCWKLFDCRGYARVDFRVDGNNQPWILEVNTNPCLSPDAGFAAALERAGIPFIGSVQRIADDALRFARCRQPCSSNR